MFFHFRYLTKVFVLCVLFSISSTTAQGSIHAKYHDITLYIMPTMHPLDWSSPATIYKTMKSCYLKTIGLPDNYLLGHLAVKLESPLLKEPFLIAQASGTTQEKVQLIFKDKIGFAILGAALTGRIETNEELKHKLKVYEKREKLVFIKYRVSEEAMMRVLAFIDRYKQKFNAKNAACDFYGGAFWPRYEHEGGSCTSFGFSLLDVINIVPPADYNWRLDLKIPQKLIGGHFNNNKKVKFTTIKKADSWHDGKGVLNTDYVKYSVYEPSIIYSWVLNKRNKPTDEYQAMDEAGVPGLFVDKTTVRCNTDEPLFKRRAEPNLFVDVYFKNNVAP